MAWGKLGWVNEVDFKGCNFVTGEISSMNCHFNHFCAAIRERLQQVLCQRIDVDGTGPMAHAKMTQVRADPIILDTSHSAQRESREQRA